MRRLRAVLMALVPCVPAWSQVAPEGNAHPETPLIAERAEGLTNPFGEMRWVVPQAGDRAAKTKERFASSVDLEPLRSLAVQHSGRVKVLDTLARETVREITGRKNYQDVVESDGRVRKIGYDPLFTFLDLMIDPGYYFDKPLVFVNYIHLRREFVEREYPGDEVAQQRWMHLTRVSPMMIQHHWEAIADAYDTQADFSRALGEVGRAISLWEGSWRNLLLVAPASQDVEWRHLSELPVDSPIPAAALRLGEAWRAQDAAEVNRQVAALAGALPAINSDVYPDARRSIEMAYNRLNAFEWGYWGYLAAFVVLVIAVGTGRAWVAGLGVALLVAAMTMHGTGFVLRCVIAERFAIQNQFESMTGVSLFAAVVGTAIMFWRRQWLFGAAAAAVGFMILVTATQTAIPGKTIDREAAILNTSVLLKYHVTTVLTSYGLISLGMILSVFYLGVAYASRMGARARAAMPGVGTVEVSMGATPGRTLADLDRAQLIVLQLAFWTLAVGILLGAWWADHSWGRWWAFDPKETFALVTWIIYLIVIHVRFVLTGMKRGLVTAWLSIAGFVAMLWCYFGVNLLLPGLHAYA